MTDSLVEAIIECSDMLEAFVDPSLACQVNIVLVDHEAKTFNAFASLAAVVAKHIADDNEMSEGQATVLGAAVAALIQKLTQIYREDAKGTAH